MKKILGIIKWNTITLIFGYLVGALPLAVGYKVVQAFGFWSIPTVLISILITYYFDKLSELISWHPLKKLI